MTIAANDIFYYGKQRGASCEFIAPGSRSLPELQAWLQDASRVPIDPRVPRDCATAPIWRVASWSSSARRWIAAAVRDSDDGARPGPLGFGCMVASRLGALDLELAPVALAPVLEGLAAHSADIRREEPDERTIETRTRCCALPAANAADEASIAARGRRIPLGEFVCGAPAFGGDVRLFAAFLWDLWVAARHLADGRMRRVVSPALCMPLAHGLDGALQASAWLGCLASSGVLAQSRIVPMIAWTIDGPVPRLLVFRNGPDRLDFQRLRDPGASAFLPAAELDAVDGSTRLDGRGAFMERVVRILGAPDRTLEHLGRQSLGVL